VRQCFTYKFEKEKRQAAIAIADGFNRPFGIIIQSLVGKIRPSCFSTSLECSIETMMILEPFRLVEESMNIRRKRLEAPKCSPRNVYFQHPSQGERSDSIEKMC
jgi:hypothetical protein